MVTLGAPLADVTVKVSLFFLIITTYHCHLVVAKQHNKII